MLRGGVEVLMLVNGNDRFHRRTDDRHHVRFVQTGLRERGIGFTVGGTGFPTRAQV
jgi:hypothetical protein